MIKGDFVITIISASFAAEADSRKFPEGKT